MSIFHQPVMARTCVDLLNLRAGGVYVDATLGGGGHALAMYQKEPGIKLYGFDQDAEAIAEAAKTLQNYNATLIQRNFRDLRTQLAYHKVKSIDGILFDLGVSSHQLDMGERGFSFDKDAPLDMRMNRSQKLTAAEIVNDYPESELKRIFQEYGEEHAAGRIAKAIECARTENKIVSTKALAQIIESVVGVGTKASLKTKVRIFQALRICVNDELNALSASLIDAINLLKPGGRIVVLSYHSLEDRIVKQTFKLATRDCICPPAIINCVCDHKSTLKLINKSPLSADAEEITSNVRSRSAKLRAAEKKKGEK